MASMTFDEFMGILSAVRADVHDRLNTDESGHGSFERLFGLDEEDATKARLVLCDGFVLTAMLLGPEVVALNYFTIGVDVGKKLAEAEQLKSALPDES